MPILKDKTNPEQFIHQVNPKPRLRHRLTPISNGILGLTLLVIIWELIGLWVFSTPGKEQFKAFLPIPAFTALWELLTSPVFWDSVQASLRRVAIGLFLAFLFGFSWGILRGYSHQFSGITHTPMQFVRMVSPLSWMPIAIFLLPDFEQAIYFLILMAAIWPIMHNTTQGIRDVDPAWVDMARIQGAGKIKLLTHVLLPSALPYILNGLRLALGIAWIILVPAEYLGINHGLGYLINDARDTLEYDRLMALVIAIGMLGFILDGILRYLGKRFDWRKRNS